MTPFRRAPHWFFVWLSMGIVVSLLAVSFAHAAEAGEVEIGGSWESVLRVDWLEWTAELVGEVAGFIEGAAWKAEGTVEYDLEAWKKLEVEATAELRGFELETKLTFDPRTAKFKKLALDLALVLCGCEIDAGMDLYTDHCWTDLRAQVELGAHEIDIKTRLGASKAFSLDFYRTDAEISFETCGTHVDIEARFTGKNGFERIDVETVLPLPPSLSWVQVEVDARLTLTEKQLSFEPEFDAELAWEGLSASIELFGEVVALDPLGLDGLAFVGVAFDASYDGAWIESRTSFAPAWNKKITKDKAYTRVVGIGYEAEDACDRAISVEAWAYTIDLGEPFDWDRAILSLAVRLVESWEFSLMACFEPGSIVEIAFGGDIEW